MNPTTFDQCLNEYLHHCETTSWVKDESYKFFFANRLFSVVNLGLLQTWFNGQKNLVAAYNNNPYVPKDVFMYNLIDGFYSAYKREVWAHLAAIDMSALEAFETRHAALLDSIN
jgi:hypothetical protein